MKIIYFIIGAAVLVIAGIGIFRQYNRPIETSDSGVAGQVLTGPRCPVMRIEDKNCEDAPYPTSIEIFYQNASEPFRIIETDGEGNFKIALEPGVYSLKPKGGNPFPKCSGKEVSVSAGRFQDIVLSCDTGIR